MANHKSAEKRNRQNLKRRARNSQARSTIRTHIKAAKAAHTEGNKEEAGKHAKVAISLLDKGVVHGLYHRKTASRTISRLDNFLSKSA